VIQHYFVSAWLPTDKVQREYFANRIDNNLYAIGALQPLGDIAPKATASAQSRLLIGPQDQRMLETVAVGLDLTVDYGWLTPVAKPIFWLLEMCHRVVGNWGWAIVLLTIIIKTLFFPLQAASYRSMARMKAVTPRMMQLRERYGSDRVKLNQAMMELYQQEKINPLGGCLPIVVQIPVFIALYWVLLASVEMRNAPWIGWIHDLALPDPYYILPLIMAATMFIQVKLNPTPPDPVQAKVMMFMPLIFSVMFFFFPAGLVLYWLVNNCYSITQQWYITKMMANAAEKKKA
jgi:YidC/Oxa1 family membrane protein insertase